MLEQGNNKTLQKNCPQGLEFDTCALDNQRTIVAEQRTETVAKSFTEHPCSSNGKDNYPEMNKLFRKSSIRKFSEEQQDLAFE